MNYETLKQRHREVRDGYPADLNLRIHRALFLPFGRAQELSLACLLTSLVVTLLKVLLIFVLASIAENTLARGRFLLIHHVTWLGFSLAALAWVFWLTGL